MQEEIGKRPVVYTAVSEIDYNLDVDISLLNSRVFTTRNVAEIEQGEERLKKGSKYLCISVEVFLSEFESALDAAAFARPNLLIIHGVLTFITQELFTPFDSISTSSVVGELDKGKNNKFKFDKISYLSDIRKIVALIESNDEKRKRVFYSSIDRYRKALYLVKESENSMIHDDEIVLSYFHILELMAEEYYIKQKQQALDMIDDFTKSMLSDIHLLEDSQFEQEVNSKKKLVESAFVAYLPVGSKILYMLKDQGILTSRLKAFVLDLIKDRNFVAHGRQVYQDRVIFPVPQFFPLIRNIDYSFDMLRILTGSVISNYLGLNHLKEEMNSMNLNLMPVFEEVSAFIKEGKYKNLPFEDFYSGKVKDISPNVLFFYLLNSKLKPQNVAPVLAELVLNFKEIEEEISQLIMAVILIVDKSSGDLKNKCIEVIKVASKNRWIPFVNMRDVLYYLEYLGHKPKILRELISKREVR